MSDLPVTPPVNPTPPPDPKNAGAKTPPSPPPGATPAGPGGSKELSGSIGITFSEIAKHAEVGKDVDLPKEVVAAGVKQTTSAIPLPKILKQAGAKPAGNNVTLGTGSGVTLPLSDAQIAAGLTKSINDSVRWLAEWCRRRLLQIRKPRGG